MRIWDTCVVGTFAYLGQGAGARHRLLQVSVFEEKGVTMKGCYDAKYLEIRTLMVCFSLHLSVNETLNFPTMHDKYPNEYRGIVFSGQSFNEFNM